MKNLFVFVTLCTGMPAHSQSLHHSLAWPFAGSGIYNVHFTDVFSFTANQASLAALPQTTAGIYAEQRFLLTSLSQYTGIVGIPVNKGGFGLLMNWFGNNQFNQSQVGLAYGKQLGKVNAGIQFNYHLMHIAGYGNDAAVTVELGSAWHISKKLCTGLQVVNPIGGRYAKNAQEKIPSVYTFGIGYETSAPVFITAAIIKEEGKPVNVFMGLQYIVDEKLFTRLGISTGTSSPFFSAGWKWKNCRTDITAGYHPQLGITPGLMIVFFGKSRKEEMKNEE